MAVERALITELNALAAKIETTTGTPIALTSPDGAMNCFDVTPVEADGPAMERKSPGTLAPNQPFPNSIAGRVTFKHEVMGGSSTDPLWMSVLLAACGFTKSTGVYKPLSGASTTITIGTYVDGRLLSLAGAMGKVTFDAEAGQPMIGSYDFMGRFVDPSAVALLQPTPIAAIAPLFAGATLTFGAATFFIPKLQIVVENTIALRKSGTDANGIHAALITGRKITVRISPEALALGTKDWFGVYKNSTNTAMNCVLGTNAQSIFTIAATKMALLNPPKYETDNGIYRDALEFVCYSLTAGGDDELTITRT